MNDRMKKNKKGQIALIVLLILVIMLTVGLAVVSRTVTELKVSGHQKEAVRAFSAAEAGIEEVLKDVSAYAGVTNQAIDITDELKVYVTVDEISNNVETEIKKNGSTKIDLNGADSGLTQLTIYWVKRDSDEDPGSCTESNAPASLEIIVYSKNGALGQYSAKRYAYNACNLDNGFDSSTPIGGGSEFLKQVNVPVDVDPAAPAANWQDMLISIRAIYNKTTVKVVGNEDLPLQQYRITSRAVAAGGEAVKAIEVSRTVSALPEIFDYVLFSGGDLVK